MLHGQYPEYDAFGPWIYPVEKHRHTLPPLFTPFREALEGNLMCFKIPRDIERRDAVPEMNLYDAVIGIFTDRILLLERKEDGAEESADKTWIPMDTVVSVYMYSCLLQGRLIFHTLSRDVSVPFNTVSESIILETIKLIRSLMLQSGANDSPRLPVREYSLKNMDHGFVNVIKGLCKLDECLMPAAYQPDLKYRVPRSFAWSPLNRLGLTEPVLSTFVVLGGLRELVVVHRMFYTGRPSSECYAHAYHFLPYASLQGIGRCSLKGPYPGLRLETAASSAAFPINPVNEEIVELEKALAGIV